MHLPAGQPAGHLNLQGKRANHANSRPLTSPLGYNSVWNRVRGYFPEDLAAVFARLPRSDPGSNRGSSRRRRPNALNHYATCLTSRRTRRRMRREEEWAGARELLDFGVATVGALLRQPLFLVIVATYVACFSPCNPFFFFLLDFVRRVR